MGAWGHGSFENDGAMDWVGELEQSSDLTVVTAALEGVVEGSEGEYVDVDACQAAVAAAEVVAALAGEAGTGLPEEVSGWVESRREGGCTVEPEVVELAVRALERVASDSEMKELWDEGEEPERWYESMADLRARLEKGRSALGAR